MDYIDQIAQLIVEDAEAFEKGIEQHKANLLAQKKLKKREALKQKNMQDKLSLRRRREADSVEKAFEKGEAAEPVEPEKKKKHDWSDWEAERMWESLSFSDKLAILLEEYDKTGYEDLSDDELRNRLEEIDEELVYVYDDLENDPDNEEADQKLMDLESEKNHITSLLFKRDRELEEPEEEELEPEPELEEPELEEPAGSEPEEELELEIPEFPPEIDEQLANLYYRGMKEKDGKVFKQIRIKYNAGHGGGQKIAEDAVRRVIIRREHDKSRTSKERFGQMTAVAQAIGTAYKINSLKWVNIPDPDKIQIGAALSDKDYQSTSPEALTDLNNNPAILANIHLRGDREIGLLFFNDKIFQLDGDGFLIEPSSEILEKMPKISQLYNNLQNQIYALLGIKTPETAKYLGSRIVAKAVNAEKIAEEKYEANPTPETQNALKIAKEEKEIAQQRSIEMQEQYKRGRVWEAPISWPPQVLTNEQISLASNVARKMANMIKRGEGESPVTLKEREELNEKAREYFESKGFDSMQTDYAVSRVANIIKDIDDGILSSDDVESAFTSHISAPTMAEAERLFKTLRPNSEVYAVKKASMAEFQADILPDAIRDIWLVNYEA
jgi:hypothetical protein